jgi:rhodanese-related sulfurtransferase
MAVTEIYPAEVKAAVAEGAQFIDVREPYEIDEVAYDIEGKMEIPLGEIQSRISEIPKGKKIIIGCRSGARSMNACMFLDMQGFDDVVNMNGGIMSWIDNGLPTK